MPQTAVTISIVLYKNDPIHIKELVKSVLASKVKVDIYFSDNSPTSELSKLIPSKSNIFYSHNSSNLGYGRANNSVMKSCLNTGDYHLVMNADVFFERGTLERIVDFMDRNESVGLVLPRVLNPDGTKQPLFKLLPSPLDLLLRRFAPGFLKQLLEERLKRYEMNFANEMDTFDAPYLSGCFMFFRKEALREVGIFDERFFLYCEDIDISRRVRSRWRTTYFSEATIYHHFNKGSYKNLRMLFYHVRSAIQYFNKHGWIYDAQRKEINQETLRAFEYKEVVVAYD